jgi:hypothetical protein
MATTDKWEWDRVTARLRDLESTYSSLRSLVSPMLHLVEILRGDPRLEGVAPNLSHLSLTLRLPDIQRYVIGWWDDREPRRYAISFVDPPLEFSETTIVSEVEVAATVVAYLERLRRRPSAGPSAG